MTAHHRVRQAYVPSPVLLAAAALQRELRRWPGILHAQVTFDHLRSENPPTFDVICDCPTDEEPKCPLS